MKTNTLVAIVLIAIGIVAFAYQGITYTTREKTVDIGPLQITHEKEHRIPLPPVLGGVTIAAGIILLILNSRKV